MRTILVLLVALFLATGAYALTESDSRGQENITSCYMIGVTDTTSGNVVVLTDEADTTRTMEWPGREVTYSSTEGQAIYGVVVDNQNYSSADMAIGKWIRIQTYGYVPIIKVRTEDNLSGLSVAPQIYPRTISAGTAICTSDYAGVAIKATAVLTDTTVTSNAISLETTSGFDDSPTVAGWLYW